MGMSKSGAFESEDFCSSNFSSSSSLFEFSDS